MDFQPGAVVNTQGFGNRAENLEVPFISDRAPLPTDNKMPVGKRWIHTGIAEYVLLSYSLNSTTVPPSLVPNWTLVVNDTISQFISLSDDLNNPAYPTAASDPVLPGNVQIKGDGISIATTASDNTITISGIGPGSQSLTGDDGTPVEPIGGTIVLSGEIVANGTFPKAVYTFSPGTNIENIEVQVGASIASSDITKVGLVAFDEVWYDTDVDGFVTPAPGTVPLTDGQIVIGRTGLSPLAAVPTNGTNISWTPGAGTLQANLTGQVAVANGGTGASTLTNHGILIGHNTSPVTGSALGDGQMLIGVSAADPAIGTISSGGGGITIAPGPGTLAISNVAIPNSAISTPYITFSNGTNTTIQGGSPQNIPLGGSVIINATTTGVAYNTQSVVFNGGTPSYSASPTDYYIYCDTTASSGQLFLPASPTAGRTIIVKKNDQTTGIIQVLPVGGVLIDFGIQFQITLSLGSATFIYNGTQWNVI